MDTISAFFPKSVRFLRFSKKRQEGPRSSSIGPVFIIWKIIITTTMCTCIWLRFRYVVCSNIFPAEIYLFKVKNGNTRKICEICPQLTIKVLERRQNMLIVEIKTTITTFCCLNWWPRTDFTIWPLLTLNNLMLVELLEKNEWMTC